jgi:hypothetical protein
MSWLVTQILDTTYGTPAWAADCLEPGCLWTISGCRPDMVEAAAFEHSLTEHSDNWIRPLPPTDTEDNQR